MKKTLIALMALAGVAVADSTLPSPAYTIPSASTTAVDISSYITGGAFTVAVTLDYDMVKDYLLKDSNKPNGEQDHINYQLINVGSGSTMSEGTRVGLVVCYSSGSYIRGTWNESTWQNCDNGGAHTMGIEQNACDDFSWDKGSSASLVMTYSNEKGLAAVFTIADTDGKILNQIGGTFHDCASNPDNFDPNTMQLDAAVLSADVYNAVLTGDQAKELGASMLVPEPTTATLSLLALAGLAARRRRK